jgi:hypothetical protein
VETETRRKGNGKTESARQLRVSLLSKVRGRRRRQGGNREERETRRKEARSEKEALDNSVSPSLCLIVYTVAGDREKKGEGETKRNEVGKGGGRPGERKWERGDGDQVKENGKGRREIRRKEVGKTESGIHSVSLPMSEVGGRRRRLGGNREER